MKLPQIIAQEGVPVVGGARMSAGAASAPYEALERTGRQLGQTGAVVAHSALNVQEEKARQERATASITALRRVSERMDEAEQELTLGKTDTFGNALEAPATHKDYVTRWNQAWAKVTKEELGSLDKQAQHSAGLLLERERIGRHGKARAVARGMYVQSETAELNELERVAIQRAALDPDPVARQEWEDNYLGAVAVKRPVIGEVEAGHRIKRFHESVALAQAGDAIRAGTFVAADYADRIDPIKLGALMAQDVREREHREATTLALHNRMKEEAFNEIYSAVDRADPNYTRADFEKDNEHLKFTAPQQKAIRDAFENRDVDDDPLVLKEVRLRSRNPDLTQADVEWLAEQYAPADGGPGRISAKSYEHWNGIFVATARANVAEQRTQDRIAKAEAREIERDRKAEERERRADKRIADAEKREAERMAKDRERDALTYLSSGLRANDLNEAISHAGKTAFSLAQDEFTRRVRAGEDPDAVARTILPKYIANVGIAAQARVDFIRRNAPVMTIEELGPPEVAIPKFNLGSREAYNQLVRQLLEAEQIELRMTELKMRGEKPAEGKPQEPSKQRQVTLPSGQTIGQSTGAPAMRGLPSISIPLGRQEPTAKDRAAYDKFRTSYDRLTPRQKAVVDGELK